MKAAPIATLLYGAVCAAVNMLSQEFMPRPIPKPNKDYRSTAARRLVCGMALLSTALGWSQAADAPSLQQSASSPANPLEEARSAVAHAEFAHAEAILIPYRQQHPGSADALYLLGELRMRQNRAAESLSLFTKAAALRSPSGQELRLVGLDYVLLNDNSDAVLWLTKATQLSPKNPEIWYSLGRAQFAKGDFAASETSFRKTLALDSRSVKAENNLGLALAAQNQEDNALAAYAHAIDMQENAVIQNEQPYLNYGMALLHRGKLEEAAVALIHATVVAPLCAQCHAAAGQALLSLNRLADAQVQMEKAVTIEPKNPRFHFELGQICKRTGNLEESRAELKLSKELYEAR